MNLAVVLHAEKVLMRTGVYPEHTFTLGNSNWVESAQGPDPSSMQHSNSHARPRKGVETGG